MPLLQLLPGALVGFRSKIWRIVATLGIDRVCIASVDGTEKVIALIAELAATPDRRPQPATAAPVLRIHPIARKRRRMQCILPLRNKADRTKEAIRKEAIEPEDPGLPACIAGLLPGILHGRQEVLLPRKSDGGRGKSRLRPDVEDLIKTSIESHYLNKQRLTVKDVAMEVRRTCELAGLPAPHVNTIARRIRSVSAEVVTRRRLGRKAAERFPSIPEQVRQSNVPALHRRD